MRTALVYGAVVLCALAAACRPREETLVVAAVRQPATALFFVARAAGCFAREHLHVEERTFDLGRDAIPPMLQGRADVAIAYETPVLRAVYGGAPLRVLTSLHSSTRNTRLITMRGSGIQGFRDLAGKRLGVATGTNADFFSEVVLQFGGVPRSAVEIVALAPEDSVRALAERRIDAAVLSDPPAEVAEQALGADAVVIPTDLYAEVSLLIVRPEMVRERAPALRALLRGLACGERLSREQPEQALALIRERFPEDEPRQLRKQVERVRWGLGLDHLLVEVLRRESEWFRDSGLAKGPPPAIDEILDASLLEQVEPEAVMLLPGAAGRRR